MQKLIFLIFCSFADDLKSFHVIKSAEDCKLLQSDIDSVQKWCIENCVNINIFKTDTVSFTHKTSSINFYYFWGDLLIILTACVKYLGVISDRKLHFHRHVDCLHSQALKLLGLIRFITCNFFSFG
jgi:hypothetical protein